MSDGNAALQAQIDRLHKLSTLGARTAPELARELEREIKAQIARGEGPDGKPWPLTKDGKQALQHAAKSLTVAAVGADTIVVRIAGVEARHHLGHVRGGIVRQIIPTRGIPDPLVRVIQRVLAESFQQTMRGAA